MSYLFGIFVNNLLPIFLIAGAGYWLTKARHVDPRALSQVIFFLFTPCLIFDTMVHTRVGGMALLQMAVIVFGLHLVVGLSAMLIGKAQGMSRSLTTALILGAMLPNSGNYGLATVKFAFGEGALAHASLYFVCASVMLYSAGVFVASTGSSNIKQGLISLVKVPAVYATALGLLVGHSGIQVPLFLDRSITLLGAATIPAMLALLGMQLAARAIATGEDSASEEVLVPEAVSTRPFHLPKPQVFALISVIVLRLVFSPFISYLGTLVFGMHGPALQAVITESATPTAVMSTVLATEYDVEPSFLATVVFLTTILSPFTLTPLLAFLGGN